LLASRGEPAKVRRSAENSIMPGKNVNLRGKKRKPTARVERATYGLQDRAATTVTYWEIKGLATSITSWGNQGEKMESTQSRKNRPAMIGWS
jgi:hypothetical protein